jgi:hypothetical protein
MVAERKRFDGRINGLRCKSNGFRISERLDYLDLDLGQGVLPCSLVSVRGS